MSNNLHITTERVEWPLEANRKLRDSVFWQFNVHDDYDQWTVEIKNKRQAVALHKKGPAAVIRHCLEDGADVSGTIEAASSNEKGLYVDGIYVEPEELIEILRKCGEDE